MNHLKSWCRSHRMRSRGLAHECHYFNPDLWQCPVFNSETFNSRHAHLVSPLFAEYGQPIQRSCDVRVSAMCWGLWILRGRPSLCCVPQLGHAHCDSHFVLRHHMLSACRRSVHLEVRKCQGRADSKFIHISLPETCNSAQISC